MDECAKLASLEAIKGKVEKAAETGRDMSKNKCGADDVQAWTSFLQNNLASVLQLADSDLKDATRRLTAEKAKQRQAKASVAKAAPADTAAAADVDAGDSDDSASSSESA